MTTTHSDENDASLECKITCKVYTIRGENKKKNIYIYTGIYSNLGEGEWYDSSREQ